MANSIHELDSIALLVDLPDRLLRRGQVGTVVMELSPDAFEVEFVDEHGKTYAIETLMKTQIMRLYYQIEAA